MVSSSQRPYVKLAIPSAFAINDLFDENDHCYINFMGTCDLSSSNLNLYPSEKISSSTTYTVWLVQAVQAPSITATDDTNAWLGETYFQATLADEKKIADSDATNTMYAQLTTAATDVSETNPVRVEVFPKHIGEYALYTFYLTWADATTDTTDALAAGQQIWLQFPSDQYGYYVGDADEWFEGDLDSDNQPLYYIPCLLSTAVGYMTGADCVAKRNWIYVTLSEAVLDSTELTIEIVGIRNPKSTDALTFNALVMTAADPNACD